MFLFFFSLAGKRRGRDVRRGVALRGAGDELLVVEAAGRHAVAAGRPAALPALRHGPRSSRAAALDAHPHFGKITSTQVVIEIRMSSTTRILSGTRCLHWVLLAFT